MSALGQKRTFAVHQPMSALHPIATAKADMPQMVMSALAPKADMCSATSDVRFGSKADMCNALAHVRFTPNSDRKSGLRQTLMSALPPKADMCSAFIHVCLGPIADIGCYSITSSARARTDGEIVRPNAFAVLRLITSAYLFAACTGSSAGFSPLRMRST
jgi:hypothetical protein